MRFANLWGILGFLVPIGVGFLLLKKVFRKPAVGVGFLYGKKDYVFVKDWASIIGNTLKILTLLFMAFSLLRPQYGKGREIVKGNVVDIMLVLDISGSMQAMDFDKMTRIAVAKEEAKRFVDGRKGDRIGLVLFASKTFLQCPLTVDHEMLKEFIDMSNVGMIEDGTAIGSAIATAINHMKDVKSKSKIIVLITDGVNNAGKVDPITSAEIAKKLGIKIYTIGVGTDETMVPFLVPDPVLGNRIVMGQTELDEELLKKIADITGGMYFRVRDKAGMREVFDEIDNMEKTEVKIEKFHIYNDLFPVFLMTSLVLLFLIVILEDAVFVSIP